MGIATPADDLGPIEHRQGGVVDGGNRLPRLECSIQDVERQLSRRLSELADPDHGSTNAAIDPLNPSTYQFNLTNNTITIPPDGPANYLQSVAANGHLSLLVTDPTIDPWTTT